MYRSPVVAHHYGSHRFLREIVSIQVLYVAESVRKRPRSAQKKVRDRSRTTVSVAQASLVLCLSLSARKLRLSSVPLPPYGRRCCELLAAQPYTSEGAEQFAHPWC